MPVAASDVQFRYSGGTTNTSAAACLGGAISTDASGVIDDGVKNDLFDDVSGAEATAGDIEYRGFYVKNNHGSIALTDASIYVSSDSTSATEEIDIGIAAEAVNVSMATIANESTAPTSVTFTHPSAAGTLKINSTTGLTAGSYRGVWLRRSVTAGTTAQANNVCTISVTGDTL